MRPGKDRFAKKRPLHENVQIESKDRCMSIAYRWCPGKWPIPPEL